MLLVGESGEEREFDRESSVIRCWIICSNFSMKRSFVSLAESICRSRLDRRGNRDRSIALTASYSEASVSGKGALKYSSSANSNRGC